MPHDARGQELQVGDRVEIPVQPLEFVEVQANPDHPEEHTPQFYVPAANRGTRRVPATVKELYPGEDACNGEFEFEDGQVQTFNTRLVEKSAESG